MPKRTLLSRSKKENTHTHTHTHTPEENRDHHLRRESAIIRGLPPRKLRCRYRSGQLFPPKTGGDRSIGTRIIYPQGGSALGLFFFLLPSAGTQSARVPSEIRKNSAFSFILFLLSPQFCGRRFPKGSLSWDVAELLDSCVQKSIVFRNMSKT